MREKLPEHALYPFSVRLILSFFFLSSPSFFFFFDLPRVSFFHQGISTLPPWSKTKRPRRRPDVETTHDDWTDEATPEPRHPPRVHPGNEQSEKTCLYPGLKCREKSGGEKGGGDLVSDEQLNKVEASIRDGREARSYRLTDPKSPFFLQLFSSIRGKYIREYYISR